MAFHFLRPNKALFVTHEDTTLSYHLLKFLFLPSECSLCLRVLQCLWIQEQPLVDSRVEEVSLQIQNLTLVVDRGHQFGCSPPSFQKKKL